MLTKNEIKYIRLLQDKKHRDQEQRFIAEGTKWIEELIAWQPDWLGMLYTTDEWMMGNGAKIPPEKVRIVPAFDLEKISNLAHPAPVVAVCKKPVVPDLPFDAGKWNLVLDGIQDPGNLGSIIRIADWFGLKSVWCSEDCADAFNPKVVQATMGSICRVNVMYGNPEAWLSKTNLPVYVSGMKGRSVFEMKTHEGILVIGSEGKGVRSHVAEKATHTLTIPRIGQAESLNAAVATGIMISKLTSPVEGTRGH